MRLATYHHRPSDATESLISEADRLSSGMERDDTDDQIDSYTAFRRTRLRAITNEITIDGRPLAPQEWVIPLEPLSATTGFPVVEDDPLPIGRPNMLAYTRP
ncbi:MAG: hypothetical protein ACUVX8_03655 [Candidatus Zipacnadales bacterium]